MVSEPRTASVSGDWSRSIEALANGTHVQLSLIGPGDKRDLLTGMAGLSKQSRYLRFFSYMPTLPKPILDGLLNTDAHNHVAIGARVVAADNQVRGPIVGVARYYRAEDSEQVAEPAVAVIDTLHGYGLGKLLLHNLSRYARAQGITHFRAHTLMDNARIRQMLRAAHGKIVDRDGPVVVYDVDIRRRAGQRKQRGVLARLLKAMGYTTSCNLPDSTS